MSSAATIESRSAILPGSLPKGAGAVWVEVIRERGPSEKWCAYAPFPKQDLFHGSDAKYRLFGGAVGPGKSLALLWEAIRIALKWPRVDTLLLRRTYPELESSIIRQFRRDVPRELYASYNESKHLVTFRNGSGLQFGWSESERDVQRFQGGEYVFVGIDELTHFTLAQWQFLTSRNRCPVPGTRPRMAGASNPGGIGHAWVKALWIDKEEPGGWDGRYDPSDYAFIPARIEDNPVYAHNADYLKTLEDLPEDLRRAFLAGDWSVFKGQYFTNFNPGRHVAVAPQLEPWWPRWVSIDWGFEHPSAVYWHAQDGARTVTYREFVQSRLSPGMLAQAIVERSEGEKVGTIYLSPDAFARHTSEDTIARQMGRVLRAAGLPEPVPADDDRIGGWMLMYQLLESGLWTIARDCEALIDCLPNLVRDDRNVEDIRKRDGDDPADAVRYGLKSRLSPARPPLDVRVQERLAALPPATTPTGQAMQIQKAIQEEKKKGRPVYAHGRRWKTRWN